MKKVLFPILAVALALSLALPMAAVAGAQPVYIETLYLSNTLGVSDGYSQLYEVVLDDATPKADLTPLPDVGLGAGIIPLEHADAIACTPDGTKIYAIDDQNASTGPRAIGVYDLTASTWTTLGNITMAIGGANFRTTDQAAFSSDGTLYVTRNEDDSLYTIGVDSSDTATYLKATLVGIIKNQATGATVDIGGADIVFDENDVVYLWTSRSRSNAPAGLYTFPEPTSTGDVNATFLGAGAQAFTGVAIRGGGAVANPLLGSRTDTDAISLIDETNGTLGTQYPMYLGGSPYTSYIYGDMTVGELAVEVGEPSITIDKETDFEGRATIGDTIEYTFEVYNDGDFDLMADGGDWWDIVSDPMITDIAYDSGDDGDELLNPGETWYYTGSFGPLVEEDIYFCRLDNTATAEAYYNDEPVTDTDSASVPLAKTVTLTAGQHIDVGTVEIWNDGEEIHVTYRTIDGWYITETHLHVAGSMEEIPQTQVKGKGKGKSGGNPIPGHFDYSDSWTPAVTEVTYDIPFNSEEWVPCTADIAVAAHAVVIKVEGDCEDPFWATGYTSAGQTMGWTTAGDPVAVAPNRSNPAEVLGEPDGVFYSLGEGGSIIVDFGYPIFNGDGDYDISVHEISGNRGDPTENADVYVIVDGIEYFAGSVSSSDQENGIGTVSIPEEFAYVDAVKIVDTTDKAWHLSLGFKGDGYDLDAVDACFLVVQEETAWSGGELENVQDFPGANWATWIEYYVMSCPGEPNSQ